MPSSYLNSNPEANPNPNPKPTLTPTLTPNPNQVARTSTPPSYGLLGRKLTYGVDYGNYMHQATACTLEH